MSKPQRFFWAVEFSDDKKQWGWPEVFFSRRDAERFRDRCKSIGAWKFFRVVKFVRAES